MLTKDLLRYRRRGDKVHPTFVDPKDEELLDAARLLIEAFAAAHGTSMLELEEQLESLSLGEPAVTAGLVKLLMDRCELVEDDGTAEELRWTVFQTAERLRREQEFGDRSEFEATLTMTLGHEVEDLKQRLYSDLPEHRRVLGFDPLEPEALLHRLNCAQVQGLLLRSSKVVITSRGISLAEKRRLFRLLKFNRLLSLVDEGGGEGDLSLTLSGPLSLFQQAQTYGMRIATFFPHVLNLKKWQLVADVKLGDKALTLELDERSKLKSHYDAHQPYVPPELTACLEAFNDAHRGARAVPGEHFLHIGRQSYCFPDLEIAYLDSGRRVHFELFHRWHAGQLKGRLAALARNPVKELRLGVCRSLAKDKELGPLLEESGWFKNHGFLFRDFPTAANLWAALQKE